MKNLLLFLQFLNILHLKINLTKAKEQNHPFTPNSRRSLYHVKPHVSVTNTVNHTVLVHCYTERRDYVREMVEAGEKLRWEFQEPKKVFAELPMICYVDMRNNPHMHGYFSAYQSKKCFLCDWKLLPNGELDLHVLRNGKWERVKLEHDDDKIKKDYEKEYPEDYEHH